MITIIVYLLLFLVSAFPIKNIIHFIFFPPSPKKDNNYAQRYTPKRSKDPLIFVFFEIVKCLLGYGLIAFSYNYFYYNNEIFLLLAALLILISYAWPIFNKFKSNKNIFSFLCGFYIFFNPHFGWVFPLLFLVLMIVLNSIELSFILSVVVILMSTLFIEVEDIFLLINMGVFLILICLFLESVLSAISNNPKSLKTLFENR